MPPSPVFQQLARTLTVLRAHARSVSDRDSIHALDQLVSCSATSRYGIFFTDNRGRYLAANPTGLRLTGFSRQELRRKSVWDLTTGSAEAEFDPLWRAFLKTGKQRGEYALRNKSGEPIDVVVYVAYANILEGVHVSILTPASSAREPTRPARKRQTG